VRRPWCAFAYQQQSSRRVQVTVLVGASVRFAAFEVLGVSLAFLGTRALSRLWPSDTRHETKLHTDQVFLTGLRSRK
jgi:hypothetical protein